MQFVCCSASRTLGRGWRRTFDPLVRQQGHSKAFSSLATKALPVYSTSPLWRCALLFRTHCAKLNKTCLSKARFLNKGSKANLSHICASLVGIGGMSSIYLCTNGLLRINCKTKEVMKTRLEGHDERKDKVEAEFDWKQFFQMLRPDMLYVVFAVACALAAAVINISIPLLMGEVVNIVSKFTENGVDTFMAEIRKPALKLMGSYITQGFLTASYISLLSEIGENMASRLRTKLFDSLLRQDVAFFDHHKTGELVDRLTSDIQDFKSSFKMCISQGLRATTQTVGCIGALWSISPKLTAIMLVVIPIIITTGSMMGSGLRKMSKEAQSQVAKATAVANEALGNIRTVRAFAMESKESELFNQETDKARVINIQLGVGIGLFQGLANVALNGVVLGTLFVGGWFMARHEITAGDLMSFLIATQTVERSLAQMSILFGQTVRGLSAGSRVFEYINISPSVPLHGGRTIPFHSMHGTIMFEDVLFSYPTRTDQVVLKNFNLSVPGGKVVALVGASGGGKSTVASLIERFYEVEEGKITLDGIDIRDLDPSWLRGQAIGFINQEPVLFATTVRENIRYGKPDATDQEVYEAAKQANAHNFVTGFPKGYDTVLGERGVTVSGGQKQRIAIARALIKNPSILVLDEATSALDTESERIVQEALDKVTKGRTVLVIAHRLSTIRDADVIAVVAGGKVVELGNHDSLKTKKGLYWELIQQQELEEEIKEFAV